MLRRPWNLLTTLDLLRWLLMAHSALGASISGARWGQATALLNNLLLVHGGKTDQYNSFSYTSAPTTNDLLLLNLSQSFDLASPPWQYISGSQNASYPQGPQLAWHTLSAYNFSHLLVFGGDGGPNSPIVLPDQADSGQILQVPESVTNLVWTNENSGWANEPSRRIHHSTAPYNGRVFIIGGEKDDGSSYGYSDHYVFDPDVPSFTRLPTTNGPPDIYGHATVMLSNGLLLVLGGYSPSVSQMIPFTTIWILNITGSAYSWSMLQVSSNLVPLPRRAFACTRLQGDKILIHGGSDAQLQTSYSDGWILDTNSNPASWSNVSSLSQLGPRRDHFAVQVGSQVLFGFGYGMDAGVPAPLSIFDSGADTLSGSYTPQPNPSYTTLILPAGASGSAIGSRGPGSSSTTRTKPTNGSNTTSINGGNPNSNGQDTKHSEKLIIALASIFGCLGLAAATAVTIFVIRRRRSDRRFYLLRSSDTEGQPPAKTYKGFMAIMSAVGVGVRRGFNGVENSGAAENADDRGSLGLGIPTNAIPPRKRIDMLANEDSSLYADGGRRIKHSDSGSSRSWYSIGSPPIGQERYVAGAAMLDRLVIGSVSSMKSMGASISQGIRRVTSEGSSRGHAKRIANSPYPADLDDEGGDRLLDPEDNAQRAYGADAEDEYPRSGHQTSNSSAVNVAAAKREDGPEMIQCSDLFDDENEKQLLSHRPIAMLRDRAEKGCQRVVSNPTHRTSQNGAKDISVLGIDRSESPSNVLSRSSTLLPPSSPSNRPRAASLVGSWSSPNGNLVKRSDSWWSRFTRRPSFGEQRYDRSRQLASKLDIDFRDPNPPPGLLGTIRETGGSTAKQNGTPGSTQSKSSGLRGHTNYGHLYSMDGRERSTSSLKTSKTADSVALEHMAGRVDVVQREMTMASNDYSPVVTGSTGREVTSSLSSAYRRRTSAEHRETQDIDNNGRGIVDDLAPFGIMRSHAPIVEDSPMSEGRGLIGISAPSNPIHHDSRNPTTGASSSVVTLRIAEYEKRTNSNELSPTSPKSGHICPADDQVPHVTECPMKTEELKHQGSPPSAFQDGQLKSQVAVNYGLVKRPQLFVANPDFRHSGSFS